MFRSLLKRRPAPASAATSAPPHRTANDVPAKVLGHQGPGNDATDHDSRGDFADQRLWIFDWPPEALARTEPATVPAFSDWLREHAECDLTRRRLCSLYFEFVEAGELCPVPWREFDRSLKDAGVIRYRSSLHGRPWRYRVAPVATVHRIDDVR